MVETIMATAAIASAVTSVGTAIYSMDQQHNLENKQKTAEREAKEAQEKADREAETARLEALAAEQTGGNRVEASDFGIDSALARRYLDENNKRQAKAQQMLEEEENPFYTRGLV